MLLIRCRRLSPLTVLVLAASHLQNHLHCILWKWCGEGLLWKGCRTCIGQDSCAHAGHALCCWMQMYLHQLMETGGAVTMPPGVLRVLKSKACRSAIMFGQPLKQQQAIKLVEDLAGTQLCFCCAHGRPTTAPLLNVAAFTCMRQQVRRHQHHQKRQCLRRLPGSRGITSDLHLSMT